MAFGKKDVKKVQKATREELDMLHKEYSALMKSMNKMSPTGLLLIAVAGIAVILYFSSSILDFVGLIMLLYPLYVFIRRGAHQEGYFEGYYDMMTKSGPSSEHQK